MKTFEKSLNQISLNMQSEKEYKLLAENYRRSAQYIQMIGLYPILETSIKTCKDDKLIK
tara:strand:+ start:3733 stop:3909 length:177 start_codon:yes stop_codon:yes gene_type:complete